MKQLDGIIQGSPEWLDLRKQFRTASEASIMMGASKCATRNELIALSATGDEKEASSFLQRIFDQGHEVETRARPIAETLLGEELFPVVAIDDEGYLLASFDGITMLEDTVWECKQWNQEKAAQVRDGVLPECDRWQVVQQLVVSGADKCVYMVTDGEDKIETLEYQLHPGEKEKLIAGWRQFDKDVMEFQPVEVIVEPEGSAPDRLPALHIEVTGKVTSSNLAEFREQAMAVIENISTDLKTDEDFANAAETVKWCKEAESRLAAAKEHALSRTVDIYEMQNTIDDISATCRAKRLELEKLVTARKKVIRETMLFEAKTAISEYLSEAQNKFTDFGITIPPATVNFASAIKGKKLFSSMQSALDDAIASAKIDIDTQANVISKNLETLQEQAASLTFLFNDLNQLVFKPAEDFKAVVQLRIQSSTKKLKKSVWRRKGKESGRKSDARLKLKQEERLRKSDARLQKKPSVRPSRKD